MNTSLRTRLAVKAGQSAAALSRVFGRGEGRVIGGKVALRLAPQALREVAGNRVRALVSATNGKTSTTRLLATGLGGEVATQSTGANMTEGVLWALTEMPEVPAVLEVDEAYLPRIVSATSPELVVLGNLSRDQLDRMNEVAMIARRWREMIAQHPEVLVIANADDPIVAFAAESAKNVVWVSAGQSWMADSSVCPDCGALLRRTETTWACTGCQRAKPQTGWGLHSRGSTYRAVDPKGKTYDLSAIQLPGRFNAANALMALVASTELGVEPQLALDRMATVSSVSGRFETVAIGDQYTRLLLAKNPAGWTELLDIMPAAPTPVIVMINSNDADGRDPSWLWDVPFERLRGRTVIASGNRRRDLAVRLLHAGVEAIVLEDPFGERDQWPSEAKKLDVIDCAATYTAFQKLRTIAEKQAVSHG